MANIKQFIAGESLTGDQNLIVFLHSDQTVKRTTGSDTSVLAVGVLLNAPASGEIAFVQTDGIAKLTAGGSITPHAQLMVSTDTGKVVTNTTNDKVLIGKYEPELEGGTLISAGDGDLITCRLYDNKQSVFGAAA
jgi:hypothetical protein